MSSATKTTEEWASELASITPRILSAPAEQVDVSISKPDASFARYIDHTLLKPDATPTQIDVLCDEALKYNFKVSPGAAVGIQDNMWIGWGPWRYLASWEIFHVGLKLILGN